MENFSPKIFYMYHNYSNLFDLRHKFTAPETITRARRKIQNDEEQFQPSQEAKERRIIRQETIKEFMIKNKK